MESIITDIEDGEDGGRDGALVQQQLLPNGGQGSPNKSLKQKKNLCSRSKKSTKSYGFGSHPSATAYSGLQIYETVIENVIKLGCE